MAVENYQIQQTISIDFATPGVPPIVYAKQYDANMRVVAVNLYDSGAAYTVPSGYGVNIRLDKQDGNYVYNPALFGSGNTVFAILTQQMLTFPGELDAEIEVVSEDGNNVLKTATFVIACAPSVIPNSAIESSSEYQTVQQLATQVAENAQQVATNTAAAAQSASEASQSATAAENSATAAGASESAAAGSASQAQSSAAAAAQSATEASQSATAAAGSATTATDQATLAQSYAVGGTGTRPGEDTDNAKYYMEQAEAIVGGDYATNEELQTAISGAISTAAADATQKANAVQSNLTAHINDTDNPHQVTAAQAGADPAGTSQTLQNNLVNGTVIPMKVQQAGQQVTVTTSTTWTSQNTTAGTAYWYQTVTVPGITASSEVSISLDADGLNQLLTDGVTAIWAENDNGTCTIKTLGAAPAAALTLYLTLVEVATV